MSPGPTQILIIALIVLLLFGASRLSEIGKGLGEGIRNFKKGLSDEPEQEKTAEKPKSAESKRLPPSVSTTSEEEAEQSKQENA